MIRGVIFDWGGVLIKDPAPGLYSYCGKYFGVSKKKFELAWNSSYVPFELGQIQEKDYWKTINKLLGTKKEVNFSLWTEAFDRVYKEEKEVFDLARKLRKKGYRIGCISNIEKPAMDFFLRRKYNLFDSEVFSCKVGVMKPSPRIFRLSLKELGLKPSEALFIDDKIKNVIGATKVGINGIVYRNRLQLHSELAVYKL